MPLLLDTHTVLWAVSEPRKLSVAAREQLADGSNELVVSAISAFELSVKYSLGELPKAEPLVLNFDGIVRRLNAVQLAVTSAHSILAGQLPGPHRDPFDRLLAAQSQIEGLAMVSADPAFDSLGVRRLW